MTAQEQQAQWREQHPLIPEEQYKRILELETKAAIGKDSYADEEEALEILEEYYPEEVKEEE